MSFTLSALFFSSLVAVGLTTETAHAEKHLLQDHRAYQAELKTTTQAVKGKSTQLVIEVRTKADFHVNKAYPSKVILKSHSNVQYAKERISLKEHPASWKLEKCAKDSHDCKISVTFDALPKTAGKLLIEGKLSLSICNAGSCIMAPIPFSKSIEIKAR